LPTNDDKNDARLAIKNIPLTLNASYYCCGVVVVLLKNHVQGFLYLLWGWQCQSWWFYEFDDDGLDFARKDHHPLCPAKMKSK